MTDSSSTPTPQPANLQGRVALITGGSRGLGAAIAQVLGESGMRVVLADVELQRAQDCAALLGERDIEAIAVPLDVADPAQCERAIELAVNKFGRLDALVNNAAVDVTAPLAELSVEDWLRVLHTNLSGPLLMTKFATAQMARQTGGGHVVNIASTASKRAWPNASAYHATKWGLLGLSHALHAELRDQGIRVGAIVAGGMKTPFLLDRFPDIDANNLQDPINVACAVRYMLQQPEGTVVPELTVLPMRETSWP
ncbi:NAD(P)-dependent dehydrogenase (short-subunit alcohol dehydrogenase family) [Pelomonas aquatica]|uniref:NAD(P)-dependent dehydrogenase (Short-subunit alcohol dehydrogenase family) n=1 Tax=Pelomonas aquatica TaxID=431058 RepID=A0ABU1ZGM6_9BURK|nr:SDR family oxidoreductase [Pelomonas aquatica]MDR7299770.1 NAD(P)-dependent dehydrogenase (short-subunit alcohol dehydrogenase family) [Pelomonas aquatica]